MLLWKVNGLRELKRKYQRLSKNRVRVRVRDKNKMQHPFMQHFFLTSWNSLVFFFNMYVRASKNKLNETMSFLKLLCLREAKNILFVI
jgi:hypothetical protein